VKQQQPKADFKSPFPLKEAGQKSGGAQGATRVASLEVSNKVQASKVQVPQVPKVPKAAWKSLFSRKVGGGVKEALPESAAKELPGRGGGWAGGGVASEEDEGGRRGAMDEGASRKKKKQKQSGMENEKIEDGKFPYEVDASDHAETPVEREREREGGIESARERERARV
jgi:hypothetical protein